MDHRLRLLMGATALLYLGPLLAGLIGMGWAGVPVFIALFALWLVIMRPAQWPRDLGRWSSQTVVSAAAQLAVNALIVVALFGVGRGIGGVAGFVPHIAELVPVAISFLATPLSRLAWDPAKSAQMDAILNGTATIAQTLAEPQDPMVKTLLSLGDDADPILTSDAIAAAMTGPAAPGRYAAMIEALDRGDPERRSMREAMILWATDPARSPDDGIFGAQEGAFGLAGADDLMLHLFAHRALPLIKAKPGLWHSFPEAVDVEKAVRPDQPANLQSALTELCRHLQAITPPEERSGKSV